MDESINALANERNYCQTYIPHVPKSEYVDKETSEKQICKSVSYRPHSFKVLSKYCITK